MKDLSICIPCYEMGGRGSELLRKSLNMLLKQTLNKDLFEVVVSDHSIDEEIYKCCLSFHFHGNMNMTYIRNKENRGSMAANTNNCIKNSSGKYIKPLYQDDFLFDENSLKRIHDNLNDSWIAHEYIHLDLTTDNFYNQRTPYYNEQMIMGINTLGPPSSTVFLNDDNYFDENLIWFIDTEFYTRMKKKYGDPTILKSRIPIGVVTTWSGQTTNTKITPKLIEKELNYVKEKYKI
jgi:glycosyltransferase involved in cell wall biosynthesis